jgi:pimeloyl-ACP methyl ester carboxylesterase
MLGRLLLLLGLLLPMPALAQTLNGDWHGTLRTPTGGNLRILFQFRETPAGLAVTPVNVDLRAETYPAGAATLASKTLNISFPAQGSSYQGTLSDDGKTIAGTWSQRGRNQPLDLTRGTITAAVLHQPESGDFTIATPSGTLAGTILKAGDGKLAAVIITGAGPANRDGNSPINGGRGIYRDIAEGLAAQGVTTLRFDKRGIGQSAAAMRSESELRIETYASDVRAWAAELKKRTGASCVWLVGHSEGALIATMAAGGNPDICGVVTLAGVGRGMDTGWREAFARALPSDQMQRVNKVVDTIKAGRTVPDPPPMLMGALRPSIQPYMISVFAQDPAALLGALKVPVLILQGEADTNVTVADAKALAAARPDAALKILPAVNHSLRIAKDDPGTGPGLLAPGITHTIADFMKAQQ